MKSCTPELLITLTIVYGLECLCKLMEPYLKQTSPFRDLCKRCFVCYTNFPTSWFFQLLQNVCYYFVVFAVVVGLAVGSFECSRFRVTTHLYVSVNKNRLLEATFVCVVFQAQTCAKSFLIFSTKWRVWKISGGSISTLRRLFLLRKGNCSYGLNFIYLAC